MSLPPAANLSGETSVNPAAGSPETVGKFVQLVDVIRGPQQFKDLVNQSRH